MKRARDEAMGFDRPPEVREIRGPEAEKIGAPMLTGDPEFDSVELRETDPLRDLPREPRTKRA